MKTTLKGILAILFLSLTTTTYAQTCSTRIRSTSGTVFNTRCYTPNFVNKLPASTKTRLVSEVWRYEEYFFIRYTTKKPLKKLAFDVCTLLDSIMSEGPGVTARIDQYGVRVSSVVTRESLEAESKKLTELLTAGKIVENAKITSIGSVKKLIERIEIVR